jgi:hypothetical protein
VIRTWNRPYSLNTLMRSIGTSFASAIAGVVLTQMTTDFGTTALPSENGFKVVMAIGAGAALLALAAFLPRQRPAGSATPVAAGSTGPAGIGLKAVVAPLPGAATALALRSTRNPVHPRGADRRADRHRRSPGVRPGLPASPDRPPPPRARGS